MKMNLLPTQDIYDGLWENYRDMIEQRDALQQRVNGLQKRVNELEKIREGSSKRSEVIYMKILSY